MHKQAAKRHFQSDSSRADLKYRRLYFDSQKKNEALTKENYELSKNLAVAMGKIEGLAESSRVCSGLLGKLQDVLLISNLGKATETAMNLSSQAVLCRCSSPSGVGDPRVAVKKKAQGVGDPKVAVKKKAKGKNN
ncbi:hypothetical protein RHMOL_Rhmol13G0032100 [Rhododendron molle]|uniref:Uncharacterized protein n=1 Tax=Rhododendron molle TaxID=49168 RepID=A0ACC0L3Z3_RHOML|nr:hypothetical protein RHMOL_Rhmol13G0032100 [Rhododendron molle]